MANLLDDIASYLLAQGVITGVGIDTFIDNKPESPDDCICIFEYSGTPTTAISEAIERSVQIVVRDSNYLTARSKAWLLHYLLDPQDRFIQATPQRWMLSAARQQPYKMGIDENNRIEFVFNLSITTYRD